MRHIIVGTAGHIDHGKTTLIRALTGINTDRLTEEQRRGITIDIGFAYVDLPSGTRAGIVDVPGHERFVKNMLAGIGGIDLAMLVIAADEGIMPQTKEHLDILSLLGIKHGIVVLTKTDLVDRQWLELVTEEVREALSQTFLKNAPIIHFSGATGEGLGDVLKALDKAAAETPEKSAEGMLRLPIDRAFVLEGIGTVVTGTLIEGTMREGDALEIYPSHIQTKVRSLQTHGEKHDLVTAGQRTAVNLSGVKKEEIHRGDVLAKPGTMHSTKILDCRLRLLPDAPTIKNRVRVRFHHGSGEEMGRMVLLNDEAAEGGSTVFVQVLLENTIAVKTGDRFIIRNYSPVMTIGGGIIVDAGPTKHKRFSEDVLEGLEKLQSGEASDILEQMILGHSADFEKLSELILPAKISMTEALAIAAQMEKEGAIINLSGGDDPIYIHMKFYEKLAMTATDILDRHHQKNPLDRGMSKEEFRERLGRKMGIKKNIADIRTAFRTVEDRLLREEYIEEHEAVYMLHGFNVKVDSRQQEVVASLMETFKTPQTPYEVLKGYDKKDKAQQVFKMLVDSKKLIKLNPETAQDAEALGEMTEKIRQGAKDLGGQITLAQARDLLGISRKQALSILDYLDKIKVTKKVGDARIIL